MYIFDHKTCDWLCQVRKLLLSLGFGDVWFNQYVDNDKLFLEMVKSRLTNFFHSRERCILL